MKLMQEVEAPDCGFYGFLFYIQKCELKIILQPR